ncbi:hypothetical protein LAZ67_15000565 [Cordylochernes scorpioides]|uniref:DUF5641 domain-containing protein n=1 Tax=Cordylochernes scorpioides TaxID=51811 RepID=A0ABY6L868_9ARAC|nr:hypothetical protein LAZ67_15000565 [Cordylochernes scorpioides]
MVYGTLRPVRIILVTNGLAERYVREFKNLLRKNNGKDDLETNLQSFLFAHRAFPQTVIKEFPGGTANVEKFKIKILEFNTNMRNPREVFYEAVRRQEQFTTGCEVYFRNYATGPKRCEGVVYKRHINQLRPVRKKQVETRNLILPRTSGEKPTTKKLISLNLYEYYDVIFGGWLADGINEKVRAEQDDAEAFFLPHCPVVKLSNGNTTIRLVFMLLARFHRSPSLNDCLEMEPSLIEMISNFLLRFINDKVEVHMMAVKSRVAPLKRPTIPRLEHIACVVGVPSSEIALKISADLVILEIGDIFLASATDLPFTGCSLSQLIKSRWWEDPSWLKLSEEYWPSRYKDLNEEEIFSEKKKKIPVVTTRCVHLELVTSLSTEDFLMALERFIKRRGRSFNFFSDNGTNFVGANNFLKQIDWERVSNDGKVKHIEWKFLPPTAAWWGRWKEYFSILLHRTRSNPKLQPGDVVLVGMDNKKRNFWPLAVIEEVLFGRDGVKRLLKENPIDKYDHAFRLWYQEVLFAPVVGEDVGEPVPHSLHEAHLLALCGDVGIRLDIAWTDWHPYNEQQRLEIELANSSEQLPDFGEKCRPHQPYVDGHYNPLEERFLPFQLIQYAEGHMKGLHMKGLYALRPIICVPLTL